MADDTTPTDQTPRATAHQARSGSAWEVFLVFLRLGLTSFGGPVAHLGYFQREVVARRGWLDDETYADTVALCQFLPGPASSQVGIAIGTARAGMLGGLAAWAGFTLPSALALTLFAFGVAALGDVTGAGWLSGLKIVTVAVVALAVWGMATTLTPDRQRVTLAALAAVTILVLPTAIAQVGVIVLGGLAGWLLYRNAALAGPGTGQSVRESRGVPRGVAVAALALFFVLLVGLPVAARFADVFPVSVFDSFYRAGSLVFGGGHVVLPLLQAEVVPPGWVGNEEFIAGYGAAQAVPGPLFTFASYLGAAAFAGAGLSGWAGSGVALAGVFLPSFLLVFGVLPFWDSLRRMSGVRAALRGVNAAVVGILLAALYDPVWTSAIDRPVDFALAVGAFVLLAFWKLPPWAVVVLAALAGVVVGSYTA